MNPWPFPYVVPNNVGSDCILLENRKVFMRKARQSIDELHIAGDYDVGGIREQFCRDSCRAQGYSSWCSPGCLLTVSNQTA